MKIVMLGHSGVGKTTYMAALYSYFNPRGFLGLGRKAHRVFGYHVKATPDTSHAHLVSLARILEKGGFPTATDRQTQYQFAVNFKSNDAFFSENLPNFTWSDYRGGALRERQAGNFEVESLLNEIRAADAIMIFADSEALLNGSRMDIRREIASMTNLLASAFSARNKRLPIVITLTKGDLLNNSPVNCWEPFQPMINLINQDQRAVALTTVVSCLMPLQNIQLPLLFCIGANVTIDELCINEEIQTIYGRINQLNTQAQDANNKAWIGNDIWSDLTGKESFSQQCYRLKQAAQQELAQAELRRTHLQKRQAPANQIRNLLLHNHKEGRLQFHGNISLLGLHYT